MWPQPELHHASEPGAQPADPHVHVPASAFAVAHGSTQTSAVSHEQPGQQPNVLTV